MFSSLYNLSRKQTPWILLSLTALGLECTALFFQYTLELEPCVLCVYERTAILGIFVSGLFVAIAPELLGFRLIGLALWASSAAWGLFLAMKHTGIQLFPTPSNTCDYVASFPDWFKLDVWIPWMFEPRGFCDEIQWQFFGYTMPQTMIAVYGVYLVVLLAIVLSQFPLLSRR